MSKQSDNNCFTAEQKIELRKKQWEIAMDGNVKMLIWLGKQYLGQSDNPSESMDDLPTGFNVQLIDENGKIIK